MQRSPIALLVVLFVALSAVVAGAQSNPATPKPGSGVPQTPVPDTAKPPAPSTQQAPPTATDDKSDTNAPSTPAATPTPAPAQPADAETKPDTEPKSDNKPSNAKPTPTPVPEPPAANPKTDILDSSATSTGLVTDGHDPILDPPPVPKTTTTLVGGTITGLDRLRNRLTVHVFGGGHWSVNFDERTHIFHNGAETTQLALKKGERVYVDTQLDTNQHDIFARNIRVGVPQLPADADGQVMEVDLHHKEVMLRDTINSVPVRFAIDDQTRISSGQTPTVLNQILPGSLVHVRFAPESPNRGLAREIDVIARPGANFTFMGRVTYLDLHRGLLAVQSVTDDKNYEIHFSPSITSDRDSLGVGVNVRIVATFEGARYTAQSLAIVSGPQTEK